MRAFYHTNYRSLEKLEVFEHHLKAANGGSDVSDYEIYSFLRHFYLLGYDLGKTTGVVSSLIYSHISQFQEQDSHLVWSQVVEEVQNWNQNGGTITREGLSEDLRGRFKPKVVNKFPDQLMKIQESLQLDWSQYPDVDCLVLVSLIGSWNDRNDNDIAAVTQILGISYEDWLKKSKTFLNLPGSPLVLKNGIWKISDRVRLLNQFGSLILEQDLNSFKALVVQVLSETNPSLEMPIEERYLAPVYGKTQSYSDELRKGLAEGLAAVGSFSDNFNYCCRDIVENIVCSALREVLSETDWLRWGSLNRLLPDLSEAAPKVFLDVIEGAMNQTPCPFNQLFEQESGGLTGCNYLSGLWWALEGLAWEEENLVPVCMALAEFANRDPGGQWSNRPINSLVTILLPWLPQTLASIEKRKTAVLTIFDENPQVAWNLIIQLLPGARETSNGSYKSKWRTVIPDEWGKEINNQEYWNQTLFYSGLAVEKAGCDASRLSVLVDNFDKLPQPAFDQFLEVLSTQDIVEMNEVDRLSVWNHLVSFVNNHRRFSHAEWALPEESIVRIEEVAVNLQPKNRLNLYQRLFKENDFGLCDKNDNYKKRNEGLASDRENAVREIFQQEGLEGVIRFSDLVDSPRQVGCALGAVVDNDEFEKYFFADDINENCGARHALINGFIWQRFHAKGWAWCDNVDRSSWSPVRVAVFLSCLPFTRGTWNRVDKWLQDDEGEYWTRARVNPYQSDCELLFAVKKLTNYKREFSAVDCLHAMLQLNQPIDVRQCVQTLLLAVSSKEIYEMSAPVQGYEIVELIKFLQSSSFVDEDDLFRVEWAYLQLFDSDGDVKPQALENRLANDPEFFCEVIRSVYKSKNKGDNEEKLTKESEIIAKNAWWLLRKWRTPPGTQNDGVFDGECFAQWLKNIELLCTESGHLEVALIEVGKVLVYTPEDQDGFWLNRVVARSLNDSKLEKMRKGFGLGLYNLRGVHWTDPTGESEKGLARKCRLKAEAAENECFSNLARTLRDLADGYDREARQIILEHKQEVEE